MINDDHKQRFNTAQVLAWKKDQLITMLCDNRTPHT